MASASTHRLWAKYLGDVLLARLERMRPAPMPGGTAAEACLAGWCGMKWIDVGAVGAAEERGTVAGVGKTQCPT